mgnify:CR=1 FL=1
MEIKNRKLKTFFNESGSINFSANKISNVIKKDMKYKVKLLARLLKPLKKLPRPRVSSNIYNVEDRNLKSLNLLAFR